MSARYTRRLVLVVLAALAVTVILRAPTLWQRYQLARVRAEAESYQPRELVQGGSRPPAPRMAPGTEQFDPKGLEDAAAYAGQHGSRALIVSRHGYIVFERYWQGTGFDTLTDAQSFTPLLAALATGIAMSHRMIGWPDEPVGVLISEWAQNPRGAITLRNLMQMSSGLRASASAPAGELLASTLATPLESPPGTQRVDKSVDPQLLALALERATHQRYASYLSQVLWRRLGAGDAWLWLDRPGGTAHADCCMLGPQGDWIRLGELLLRDGNYQGAELIRPGWITLLRAPAKADPRYGAFVRLAERSPGQEPYATRDVFLVGGAGGNRLWLVPSLQIAILCTGARGGRDAAWDDSRVPNLIVRAARDYVPPPARPGADISSMVPGHRH
jgi:CubicO group peptidase (beta-lactamase class C family)